MGIRRRNRRSLGLAYGTYAYGPFFLLHSSERASEQAKEKKKNKKKILGGMNARTFVCLSVSRPTLVLLLLTHSLAIEHMHSQAAAAAKEEEAAAHLLCNEKPNVHEVYLLLLLTSFLRTLHA